MPYLNCGTKTVNGAVLHDQILAALPVLRAYTEFGVIQAGDRIWVSIPATLSNQDGQVILNVVAAHDPNTPNPPTPTLEDDVITSLESTATVPDKVRALALYFRGRVQRGQITPRAPR